MTVFGYELPEGSRQPAHLALDRDGMVWYTAFWGNRIGRLDPESGKVLEYPLPKSFSPSKPAQVLGSGPWQITVAPDGDIVFNEYFDATIGRFGIDRATDSVCLALDSTGHNPCIREIADTGIDLANDSIIRSHLRPTPGCGSPRVGLGKVQPRRRSDS